MSESVRIIRMKAIAGKNVTFYVANDQEPEYKLFSNSLIVQAVLIGAYISGAEVEIETYANTNEIKRVFPFYIGSKPPEHKGEFFVSRMATQRNNETGKEHLEVFLAHVSKPQNEKACNIFDPQLQQVLIAAFQPSPSPPDYKIAFSIKLDESGGAVEEIILEDAAEPLTNRSIKETMKEEKDFEKFAENPVDPFPNPVLAPPDAAGLNREGARFGCTRDNGTKMHSGIDLKAAVGTEFVSIYSGVVQDIRTDVSNNELTSNSVGNFVIVKSVDKGISIKYCHLFSVAVKKGENVTQTTKLGKTGRSGNAYNAPFKHTHIEVSTDYFATNQKYVDPEKYLKTTYGPNTNPNKCP